ncbi:hypothetical protein NDU88_003380 [Pleurodeles waltl]|uniref:MHC class I antigen n=1 Tax=Pleurodeles waltl TaxID=8319 RepID=A0AAV7SDH3_PLEWA|nr:hypothetical protein NDU88_003380 [Pleurodeles waltl]
MAGHIITLHLVHNRPSAGIRRKGWGDMGAYSTRGERGGGDAEEHAGTWKDLPGDAEGSTEVDRTIRE